MKGKWVIKWESITTIKSWSDEVIDIVVDFAAL